MATKTLAYKKRKKKYYPAKKKEWEDYIDRLPKYTFGTVEKWNIFVFIANYIVQALQAYKDHDKAGVPYGFEDMDDWNATIQKMIDAFDILRGQYFHHDEEEERIIKEGFDLFHKYFRHLWD